MLSCVLRVASCEALRRKPYSFFVLHYVLLLIRC